MYCGALSINSINQCTFPWLHCAYTNENVVHDLARADPIKSGERVATNYHKLLYWRVT